MYLSKNSAFRSPKLYFDMESSSNQLQGIKHWSNNKHIGVPAQWKQKGLFKDCGSEIHFTQRQWRKEESPGGYVGDVFVTFSPLWLKALTNATWVKQRDIAHPDGRAWKRAKTAWWQEQEVGLNIGGIRSQEANSEQEVGLSHTALSWFLLSHSFSLHKVS